MINRILFINIIFLFLFNSINAKEYKYFLNYSMQNVNLDLPRVLSQQDIDLYEEIGKLQIAGKFEKADEKINQLDNQLLVPYYLFLRYKQSNYNPSTQELMEWMDNYNTTAVSNEVRDMITSRNKSKKKTLSLKSNNSFYDRFIPIYLRHSIFHNANSDIAVFKEYKPELVKNFITKRIDNYLKKGKTLNVKNILLGPNGKKYLNKKTYDYYASKLGRSYFLDGDDKQSIYWNKIAIEQNMYLYPDSLFTLGLSYYRMKQFPQAMEFFKHFYKNSNYFSTESVAKGSYWYARINLILNNIEEYYKALKFASLYKYNFYGIIASAELGLRNSYDNKGYDYYEYSYSDMINLSKTKYGQRALALLQMGFHDWAEQEFIFLANYEVSTFDSANEISVLNALIYLSKHHHMPALSLKIAGEMGMYYGFSQLSYPLMFVDLRDNFEVDPALLHAIMRRESNFYSGAKSSVGARGLMQLMPNTAHLIISKYNFDQEMKNYLNTKKVNIELGQKYLKLLLDNENVNRNLIYVIGGYNGGLSNIIKWEKQQFRHVEDPLFFIESIPYYETRNYIKSVLSDYWIYQEKLEIYPHSLRNIAMNKQPTYSQPTHDEILNIKQKHNLK